jgi:hypothetical protein
MLEGAGKEELGEDFWGPDTPWGEDGLNDLHLGPTGHGCEVPGLLSMAVTAIVFILIINLRRSKAVR